LSKSKSATGQSYALTEDFEDLYENAPCGYLSLAPDGRIVKVNATFCRWLGFDAKHVAGCAFIDLLHVSARADYETQMVPLLRAQGYLGEVALDLLMKDRKMLPMIVSAVERRDARGRVLFTRVTVNNAADRFHYELQLVEAQVAKDAANAQLRLLNTSLEQRVADAVALRMSAEESLRQSQKMEAVGQLTGGIAHDFNNLLAGITGSIELIEIRIKQGRFETLARYLEAAKGAAKRAAALTHRLLAFSRQQQLAPKTVNVNQLIAEMEDMVRRTIGPAITLEVVGAGGVWPALIDPNQLENALLNLCINARDAMPTGGRMTIETANKWLDDQGAKDRDISPGQYVSVCVTDNGTGMTPEVMGRAFDPFYTTKPIGAGTGLGLSMVYGFARQSGGQVRIYSEIGQGTTMCIYLPRHRGDVEELAPLALPRRAKHFPQTESVLVVDDEPTMRMLITEVLEDAGYHAIAAIDGPSALQVLQADPNFSLLITDVGLPGGLNGRQVADAARLQCTNLKVLFVTGYAENAAIGHGHLDHDMQLLTKPFTVESLLLKVKELLPESRDP
jgi:PAS domain S-box-containing protein